MKVNFPVAVLEDLAIVKRVHHNRFSVSFSDNLLASFTFTSHH